MQRIASLAADPEFGGGLAPCSRSGLCAWKKGLTGVRQPAVHQPVCARVSGGEARRKLAFAGQKRRLFSSQPGADGAAGGGRGAPELSPPSPWSASQTRLHGSGVKSWCWSSVPSRVDHSCLHWHWNLAK
ncbi:hypothetical protein JOB18_020621 [Solea senegalensis]|uniref:Uncharacterized protein n=1 Tax=Solea senegalensis TaxID=28829 RepID=A0AAV6PUG6_SOLSE|nr:hypothetical protein JOB18_020621 [Solea senegalensis]